MKNLTYLLLTLLITGSFTACSDEDDSNGDNNSGNNSQCPDNVTEIVDVTNPITGRTWMDRNLGASRAATSSSDTESYGFLYQWGRCADGHQIPTSSTTSSTSENDQAASGDFILGNQDLDWREPQNDNLWQGALGNNNPCPSGYRLPTAAELDAERESWISNDANGAFASPLKLPAPGFRDASDATLYNEGFWGDYWSSSIDGSFAKSLFFDGSSSQIETSGRSAGYCIRCIKD